ncbi:MAG: alpha/beta hydrolase [Saprospiraceae bacterium]|nr:alpha/beta hydrolase [Saprospiraceae bacterium]
MNKIVYEIVKSFYSNYLNTAALISPKFAARQAFKLFKTPRARKLTASEIKYLKSAQIDNIQVKEHTIAVYHWKGTGPSILLVHGWESNSARWRLFIKMLQDLDYNIYALDAPAHGMSTGKYFTPLEYAEAIDLVVRKFKIQKILAHSVGAYATIIYASMMHPPENLDYLILKAPTGSFRRTTETYFDLLNFNLRLRKAYVALIESSYDKTIADFASFNLIKNVDIPGILIHDKTDRVLPIEDSHLIDRAWTNGKFIITEHFGHRMNQKGVIRLIRDLMT